MLVAFVINQKLSIKESTNGNFYIDLQQRRWGTSHI